MSLEKGLTLEAGDGENGITPKMAKEIEGFLDYRQGGMSADMRSLLEGLEKDGGTLSDASVAKLRRAAREAKSRGLKLGVSAETEEFLLAPDPSGASAAPDAD
jgi:hypothetical protein